MSEEIPYAGLCGEGVQWGAQGEGYQMRRTTVIAELGCTHEGSPGAMYDLIAVAAQCGADVVKLQWTSNARLMADRRYAADYYPYYKWLQWPKAWHPILRDRCETLGMRYACTVYLPEDVAVIEPFVSLFKISSFEARDGSMLRAYGQILERATETRHLLISLGMGAPRVDVLAKLPATTHALVKFLRCVSAYPTPVTDLRLSTIRAQGLAGLSDHSTPVNVWTGALAVAAGAQYVERHIKLTTCPDTNPDAAVAQDVHQFYQYVMNLRFAEEATGEPASLAESSETPMLPHQVTAI